ncbi:MAG: rhodanese-like domain-containing protein [Holophagales bacterium]|nr:rhodanese-like domain-containing protein [Holophagales bacterium]
MSLIEPTPPSAPAASAPAASALVPAGASPAGPAWRRTFAEAAVIAASAGLVALAVNAFRPAGLPLVAPEPYEVLVPCPEPGGPVAPVEPSDSSLRGPRVFLVDARDPGAYRRGHVPGAVNVPYDWLDPLPQAALHELARRIAASGATRVVVYGDGGRPDSGEHLGREISGRGLRNVGYVRGGAPALVPGGAP